MRSTYAFSPTFQIENITKLGNSGNSLAKKIGTLKRWGVIDATKEVGEEVEKECENQKKD